MSSNTKKEKFGIQKMAVHIWKFYRMRAHFPTLRLAQLSEWWAIAFLYLIKSCKHKIRAKSKRFLQQPVSDFWCDHFHFKDSAHPRKKHIWKANAGICSWSMQFALFLYYYGQVMNKTELCDKSISMDSNYTCGTKFNSETVLFWIMASSSYRW